MARTMTPEDIQTLVTRLRSSVDARMRGTLGQLAEQRKVQIGVLEREQELVAEPAASSRCVGPGSAARLSSPPFSTAPQISAPSCARARRRSPAG